MYVSLGTDLINVIKLYRTVTETEKIYQRRD